MRDAELRRDQMKARSETMKSDPAVRQCIDALAALRTELSEAYENLPEVRDLAEQRHMFDMRRQELASASDNLDTRE